MAVGLKSDDEAGSVVSGSGQHPSAGTQRLGPYRLIQPLGEGGMGVVHLAIDPSGRAVAVKVLREHIAHDRDARNRLRREVETLALVQDSRVAAVLDADTEGVRPYIVTRYVPGPALDLVVSELGPLQGEGLLRLGRGLWDALKAIHGAGVIHRDLKPANVLLLDGDPVVIDFGIAHVADDVRLTVTGLVMGTPGYLAPEVLEGSPVTQATDWWGWAATLAFAASGAPPFGRGPVDVVLDRVRRGKADLSGVDQRLAPLLVAALSPFPTQRPHADEIVQALDWYAAGAPPTIALPVASPTRLYPSIPTQRGPDPSLPRPQQGEWAPQVRPGQPTPAEKADQKSVWNGAGQPDPRRAPPSRVWTMLALLVGVLGVATIWPAISILLVVLWSWSARVVDRSITSMVLRRHERGHRRSDLPLAVVASPWHAVVAALTTVLALVLPAIVAIGSTFSIALAYAAATGGNPAPDTSAPLLGGGFFGLLMYWWGPGGGSLRRGSRSLLRGALPGQGATAAFLGGLVALIGVGLATYAFVRQGQPDWWPWSPNQLPAIPRLFR
jgi:serine/threonine protein kinase